MIPKGLRMQVGLEQGGIVGMTVEDGRIILQPVKNPSGWRRWRGALSGSNALQELMNEHRGEVEKDEKGS